jgi:hypothetical protein
MKKISTLALLLITAALYTTRGMAQSKNKTGTEGNSVEKKYDYKNALGIRAGGTSGITYKHFLNTGNAVEGILGIWQNAIGITGLYEKHQGLGLEGLKFYYGAGAHFTAETGSYYYTTHRNAEKPYRYRYGRDGFGVGIDGIVGLDYKIGIVPLAFSLDLKPYLEISNYGTIYTAIDPSLGIKIAF